MVDAIGFQENKPNYPCPRVQRVQKVRPRYSVFGACETMKPANVDPNQLKESELLICSPAVLDFCLGSKTFRSCSLSITAVFGSIRAHVSRDSSRCQLQVSGRGAVFGHGKRVCESAFWNPTFASSTFRICWECIF